MPSRRLLSTLLERTLRESQTRVETAANRGAPGERRGAAKMLADPAANGGRPARTHAQFLAPEGYSFGTYHGFMQRAPSSGDAVKPPYSESRMARPRR